MLTISNRQFWAIFRTKLSFNLRSEVATTYLGYLWWLLEPVMWVTALYIVFGILLRIRAENFMMFLVVGMVAISWFSKSVGNASRSLIAGKGLINQVAIPKLFFPLLTVSQDFVKQAIVFIAMFGFLLAMGLEPTAAWFSLPVLILTQCLLILAAGMVFAGIVPLIPDFKFLISSLLQILMWGSGIFYSYEDVLLPRHQELFLMNPMANLIKNYRQVILDGVAPDWTALFTIALFSISFIIFMCWVFKKLDTTYARLAIQ